MPEPTRKSILQLSMRIAIAAAAGVAIGQAIHLQQLSQCVVTAALVTDLSPVETRRNALGRFAGTALGALIGAAMTLILPPHALVIGLGILASMLIAHFLKLRRAARVAGFVCGIVLLGHSDQPFLYAMNRLAETTLGIALCVAISWVPLLLGDDSAAAESAD